MENALRLRHIFRLLLAQRDVLLLGTDDSSPVYDAAASNGVQQVYSIDCSIKRSIWPSLHEFLTRAVFAHRTASRDRFLLLLDHIDQLGKGGMLEDLLLQSRVSIPTVEGVESVERPPNLHVLATADVRADGLINHGNDCALERPLANRFVVLRSDGLLVH